MKITLLQFILLSPLALLAADAPPAVATASNANKQVMPAKKRAEIVATAQALFEPQVKNSVKIGRVSSPFAPSSAR